MDSSTDICTEDGPCVREKLNHFIESIVNAFENQVALYAFILSSDAPTIEFSPIFKGLVKIAQGTMEQIATKCLVPKKSLFGLVPIGGQLYKFVTKRTNRQRAKELAYLIYQYVDDKTSVERILVEAGIKLFYSFEMQIVNLYIDKKQNNRRAIRKLGLDIVKKMLNNFIKVNEYKLTVKLTVELIISSVITQPDNMFQNFFSRFTVTPYSTHKVILPNKTNEEQIIKVSSLFWKVGRVNDGLYYKTPVSNTSKYGYRRLFEKEQLSGDLEDNQFLEYQYVFNDANFVEIDEVLSYIKKRNPKKMEARLNDNFEKILEKIDDIPLEDTMQKIFEQTFAQMSDLILNQSKPNNENKDLNVVFQLKDPVFNFVGRASCMNNIHAYFNSGIRFVVLTGIPGIGKSDLVRKYCQEYKLNYQNILWIDSETENNMTESFKKIAIILNVPLKNNDSPIPISNIIQTVYDKIRNLNTLIIFDNVESLRSMIDVIPFEADIKTTKIDFIITTQNTDWDSLKFYGCEKIVLASLTDDEAVELMKTTLHAYIKIEESDLNSIRNLCEDLGCLPLAMQQAIAYIIEEIKIKGKNQKEKIISDYQKNCKILLNQQYDEDELPFPDYYRNEYSKTIFTTIQISLEKLKKETAALFLLNVCSFLNPEAIERHILNIFMGEELTNKALRKLEKYSLANIQDGFVSFHRLVLEIVRQISKLDSTGQTAYQYVLFYIMSINDMIFFDRRVMVCPREMSNSEFIFKYADDYQETVLSTYKQLDDSKRWQLFFILTYFGYFEIVKKIYNCETSLNLTGYFKEPWNILMNVMIYEKYAGPATIIACFEGHIDILKFLLENGANINEKHTRDFSLLHAATCRGHFDIVKYLLGKNADLNIRDGNGSTILHTAVVNRHLNITEFLINNKKLRIDVENNFGDTVLHGAACFGYSISIDSKGDEVIAKNEYLRSIVYLKVNLIKMLSPFVDSIDSNESSDSTSKIEFLSFVNSVVKTKENIENIPLKNVSEIISDNILKVMSGNTDVIQFLLKNEAKINVTNRFGYTPLHLASCSGAYEMAVILLNNDADVNKKANDDMTPLHMASFGGFPSIVKLLLDNGSQINDKGEDEATALHFAAHNGHLATVKILVEKMDDKSNINSVDICKRTPFLIAVIKGFHEIVKYLISIKGNNINLTDMFGRTALHWCICQGNNEIVHLLFDNSINIDVKDVDGNTELHLAADKNNIKILQMLLERGANIDEPDQNKMTPLHRAIEKESDECVEFLIDKKANINSISINNVSILTSAVKLKKINYVNLLISEGVEINNVKNPVLSPLVCAYVTGDYDIFKLLLDNGANIQLLQDSLNLLSGFNKSDNHQKMDTLLCERLEHLKI